LTQQEPDTPNRLDYYADSSSHQTVIRGHKLYWHKGEKPEIAHPNPAEAGASQLTQIKPLKPGVSFTFTIKFENLNQLELGALLWVLDLGSQDNYRLKLGMGKPLGMGAVKTETALHLTNRPARYSCLFNGDDWQLGHTDDGKQVFAEAVEAFEKFIKDNHIDAFGGEGRIDQLKALLRWPGPAVNETEYMTDLTEFKERKVLPTPPPH
jgi:CRISPR-associated protein (TIGR03986 family)